MNLFKKTNNAFFQLIRYGVSGGIAFVVDFCLLYVLKEYAGFHYLVAGTISFCAGLIVTYLFSIYWIFSVRKFSNRKLEFGIFTLIGAVGIALNFAFLWLFASVIHQHYLLAKIITTVIVTLWNFLAKKYILFHINSLKTKY
jgi:putative flippase GtrA